MDSVGSVEKLVYTKLPQKQCESCIWEIYGNVFTYYFFGKGKDWGYCDTNLSSRGGIRVWEYNQPFTEFRKGRLNEQDPFEPLRSWLP